MSVGVCVPHERAVMAVEVLLVGYEMSEVRVLAAWTGKKGGGGGGGGGGFQFLG